MRIFSFVAYGAAIVVGSAFAPEKCTFAQFAVPAPLAVQPPREAARSSSGWGEAEYVFTAKLENVTAGPVGNSCPPVYINKPHLTVAKCLRGALKSGETIDCVSSTRQKTKPTFPIGERFVIAAGKSQGEMLIVRMEVVSDKNVSEATLDCKMPLGWQVEDGKLVSPWAALGGKAWPVSAVRTGDATCSKTGRPALMVGEGVRFSVEPAPPKESIEWINPDGDGEYKVTVTNITHKPASIPALLFDGKTPQWAESMVIRCDGRTYLCPG